DIGVGAEPLDLDLDVLRECDLIYVSYAPRSVIALVEAGLGDRVVVGWEDWMTELSEVVDVLPKCRLLITNEFGWATLMKSVAGQLKIAIETRGSKGARVHKLSHPDLDFAPLEVEAIDATGAGDSFAATVCHYLAVGLDVSAAVTRANIAGALATTASGSMGWLPTTREIESRLEAN